MSMNFKFGIELEFADLTTDAVMRVLSDAGIRIVDRGYTHADYSDGVWKVVPDSSVRNGLEVVSPVLFGEEGLAECVKVAQALEAAEASINRTCGFPVCRFFLSESGSQQPFVWRTSGSDGKQS